MTIRTLRHQADLFCFSMTSGMAWCASSAASRLSVRSVHGSHSCGAVAEKVNTRFLGPRKALRSASVALTLLLFAAPVVTLAQAPTKPAALYLAEQNGRLQLWWQSQSNLTATEINYRHTDGSFENTLKQASFVHNSVTYGANNGEKVQFRIRFENSQGFGPWSDFLTGTPGAEAFTASNVTPNSAKLTLSKYEGWGHPTHPSREARSDWSYQYTSPLGGICTNVAKTGGTEVNVTGLNPGATYAFKAYSGSGCSASNLLATAANFSISTDTAPDAPSRLVAEAGDARVTLSWISGGDGGSGITAWQYRKREGEGDWGDWRDICRTAGEAACAGRAAYVVEGLVNGAAHRFQVRAVNALGNGAASPESAAATPVADLVPSFVDALVADQNYTQNAPTGGLTLPEATGGDGVLTYTLTPAPPTGLSFDAAARTLSGTPTEAMAETEYRYAAMDADAEAQDSVELTFRISVAADMLPSFGDASVADRSYQQGIPIEALTLPKAAGGDGGLKYGLTPMPPEGLNFDAATRVLSGTPTSPAPAAVYRYTATDADDTNPDSAVLTFTIEVAADEMPAFGAEGIPDLRLFRGQPMEPLVLPGAAGGNGEIVYSLGPELPEGLSFDAGTRVLGGIPVRVSGPVEMEYRATDSDPREPDTAVLRFSIRIVVSEADRAVLNDALAAQGRALLASAEGVIGERFRAPSAPATGGGAGEAALGNVAGVLSGLSGGASAVSGMSDSFAMSGVPAGGVGSIFAGSGDRRAAVESVRGAEWPGGPRRSSRGDPDLLGLMGGHSFAVPLGAAGRKNDDAHPRLTLWGAADAQRLEGDGHDSGVVSLYIGADARFADGWLAGAALSRGTGESDYSAGGFSGTLETELTSLMPYIRGETRSGLEVWAMGGFGTGEAEDRMDGADAVSEASDLEMAMFAAGLRRALAERGAWQLSLVGGGGYLSLETEGGLRAVDGLEAGVSQARLGLEVSHLSVPLSPYLRVGARGDGGDGESGSGLEVLAGVRHAGERFDFEAQARWLATHSQADYEEFGGSVRLELRSRADGSGLRLSLAPGWGVTGAGALLGEGGSLLGGMDSDRLLRRHEGAAGRPPSMSLDGRLGYGFALDRGLLSLDADHSGDHWSVRQSLGASWESLSLKSEPGNGLRFRLGYEIPNQWTEGGAQFELVFSRQF